MAALPVRSAALPRAPRALVVSRMRVARPPSQRCAGLSEVGAYLQEAVEHIFQTEPSTAPFKASSFSGPISHDDHGRLRKIYKLVKKATPEDPSVATAEACEETAEKQKRYLQGALEKVFSSKTDEEPEKWVVQPFEGNITSKREIERMLFMEKVMRKTLEAADKQK